MKIRGLTAEQVDLRVEVFNTLMLKGMHQVCKTAANHMLALTAAGVSDGELSNAVDSLGGMNAQWGDYAESTLQPFLVKTAHEAGQAVATPLGVDADPQVQFLTQMEGWVSDFAGDMWQTAKTALITGAQDGESMAELANRVEQVTQVKAKKAHAIAQTAVIASINGGEWHQMMAMAKQFDVNGMKEWEATEDSHTRPAHHAADGQRVPIDSHFVVGGEFMLFPGDPTASASQVANCRCTTLYDLDVEDQITASQTSSETQTTASAVGINGLPAGQPLTAAVNAAFNAQHPRGKDGKFIKKGEGLPEHVLQGLIFAKKDITWDLWTPEEKDHFISEVNDVSLKQWDNLKTADKEHIKKLTSDAVDDGQHGAAKASLHLDKLVEDQGNSGALDDGSNVFDPNTPLPKPSESGAKAEIDKAFKDGKIGVNQQHKLQQTLDTKGEDAALAELHGYVNPTHDTPAAHHTPSTPSTPAAPTGSGEPLKITHGLIHAKHDTGATIAQSTTGTKIVWNGNSYDIITPSGDNGDKGVKKSKLYALLNTKYQYAQWKKPSATPSHTPTPTPAAPTPHVPHTSDSSHLNDQLDDAFGPLNTGLAPAPTGVSTSTVDSEYGGIVVTPASMMAMWNASGGGNIAQAIDKNGVKYTVSKASHTSGMFSVSKGDSPDKELLTHPEMKEFAESKGLMDWHLFTGNLMNAPHVAPPTPVAPTHTPSVVTAADVPSATKTQLYNYFKAEKVSPAWSGAKIYASMHAAKAKMAGDPKVAALSDSEMLKVLDIVESGKKASVNNHAYENKVKEWLKTPNGQKAFKQLNPAISTPPPSIAKKVAKKASPGLGTPAVSDPLGNTDVASSINQTTVFTAFKNATYGKYLNDKPEHIYWNAVQQSKVTPNSTPGSILTVVDAQSAKKFGVPDEKKFSEKVKKWLATPSGKKTAEEIKAGTYSPIVATPSYSSYGGSSYGGSYTHPANTPLNDKIPPIQKVEPYDPSKNYTWKKGADPNFPTINHSQAQKMVDSWSASQGPLKANQKSALRKYTGNSYSDMNDYLRGYSGATDTTHKDVQTAQAGMRLSEQPITLHRGNGWFSGWTNVAQVKSHLGEDFHQEAFFSSSIGGKSAFSGPINFVIECPPGTPMQYVKTFSKFGGEDEMLLGGNLTYRVVEVIEGNAAPDGSQHYNTKVTVRLRVIPPSANQISYGSAVS